MTTTSTPEQPRITAAERKAAADREREDDAVGREMERRLAIREREDLMREVSQRVALETFDPGEAPGEPGWHKLTADPTKVLTGVEIERGIAWAYNEEARCAIMLMNLVSAETAAEIELKQRRLVVTSDSTCPLPQRGSVTVGERDDWVLAQTFEEYVAHELAKKRVKNCRDYLAYLDRQTSRLQTLARTVVNAFNGAGR